LRQHRGLFISDSVLALRNRSPQALAMVQNFATAITRQFIECWPPPNRAPGNRNKFAH
jgi:hypothetical protein